MKSLVVLISLLFALQTKAQQFVAFGELAWVRSQMDGDNTSGYSKNGVKCLLGVDSRLTNTFSIEMILGYGVYGSNEPAVFSSNLSSIDILEVSIKAALVETGLVIRLNRKTNLKLGAAYHSFLSTQHKLLTRKFGLNREPFDVNDIGNSTVFAVGALRYSMHEHHVLTFGMEAGTSNILSGFYTDFLGLRPYYVSLGYRYVLNPRKMQVKKGRKKR